MRLILYYASFALGLVFAVILNIFAGKKNGAKKRETAICTVAGFVAAVIGAILMAAVYNFVLDIVSGGSFTKSRVSLYGGLLFMPPLVLIFSKSAGLDFSAVTDNCCSGVFALLGTAKLGCFAYGCCYGIEFEHGVYNATAGTRVFPVQLLESAMCFLLAAILLLLCIRPHKKGTLYPKGLILYGIMRFFVQFLRFHEVEAEKNLLGFMDLWQCVSLVAVICGIIWLISVKTKKSIRQSV